MSGTGNKPREITIELLCPSLSKMTQVVVWEDQRIDLGSISRAFGLDPSTLRLKGHFISRGVASSLTWNSLLSFFSSKDLPTGRDQCDALFATGKLCKVGLKRGHDSLDFQNGIDKMMESKNAVNIKGNQLEAINLIKNKKLKESSPDIGDKIDDHSGSIARNQFTCGYEKTRQLWQLTTKGLDKLCLIGMTRLNLPSARKIKFLAQELGIKNYWQPNLFEKFHEPKL